MNDSQQKNVIGGYNNTTEAKQNNINMVQQQRKNVIVQ